MRNRQQVLVLLVAAALPLTASAWGPVGHRTVAGLAQERLSEPVQQQVRQLLQPDNESSLVDVATWADDLRDTDPARYRSTGKLHYVNFSSAQCSYQPQRDCRKGECVVAAIERYQRILADRSRPREERADALRFVVHFVGDVHQPLHASFKPDKGGNTVQLRYGRENWNLHAVWDSLLLKSTGLRWPQLVSKLETDLPRADATTPAQWAEESCVAVRDGGVYPDGNSIDDAYLERELPLAERRLQQAAARLAALLERTLAGRR